MALIAYVLSNPKILDPYKLKLNENGHLIPDPAGSFADFDGNIRPPQTIQQFLETVKKYGDPASELSEEEFKSQLKNRGGFLLNTLENSFEESVKDLQNAKGEKGQKISKEVANILKERLKHNFNEMAKLRGLQMKEVGPDKIMQWGTLKAPTINRFQHIANSRGANLDLDERAFY